MTDKNRWLLLVCTLVGLTASTVSAYVGLQSRLDSSYASFCDINATMSCTDVYLSQFGSLWGVPVAFFGIVWFVLNALLILAGPLGTKHFQESVPGYLFACSTIGLAVVFYLGYASLFLLGTVCVMCVIVYLAVIGIFMISGATTQFKLMTLPLRIGRDLRQGMTSPIALSIAGGFVVATVVGAAWLGEHQVAEGTSSVRGAELLSESERDEFIRWWEAQPRVDLPISADDSSVLIVKFNDYMCPPCRQTYLSYHGLLQAYEVRRPGAVRLVTKHFPLDPECNASTPNGMHLASCDAAVAVTLAKRNGQDARLEAWLFDNQATLSPVSVRAAARDVADIQDYDSEYARTLEVIKSDIALANSLAVDVTPTFVINGVRVAGGLTVPYLDAAIAYELAREEKNES